MRWIKRVVLALLGLVALIVLGLGAFIATFDANDYRPQVVDLVKQQTGRDLRIDGDLSLILFSWRPGLELQKLQLSNAEGFGERPFAVLNLAQVEVEWLPLLRNRELEVTKILLDGMRLNLARNAAGVGNWEDLAGAAPAEPAPSASPGAPAPAGDLGPLGALTLGAMRISDASVRWDDAQAGSSAEVTDFSLTSERVRVGEPFPLQLGLNLASSAPPLKARIDLGAEITADPARQSYRVKGLDLRLDASGAALPVPRVELSLGADLEAELAAQLVKVSALRLAALGLNANGEASVRQFAERPAFEARLAVAPFNLRELLARLQLPVPETADPKVLTSLALELQAKGDTTAAEVPALTLALDDSRIKGKLAATNLQAALPALRFELALDELDADRYLPPPAPEPPPAAEAPPAGDEPLPIPVGLLRDLDLEGRLTAGRLKVSQLRVQDAELAIRAKQGRLVVEPLTLNLYEGILRGAASMDASGEKPTLGVKLKLAGVKSEPLLNDLLDLDLVRGRADAEVDLSTSGIRISELKSGLNGNIAASFTDGALKGYNLGAMLREAEAKLKGKQAAAAKAERQTDFTAMGLSASIVDGVLRSQDLDLRAPLLRVGGAGLVDLGAGELDYLAQVKLIGSAAGQGGEAASDLTGLNVPIRVKGPFGAPKVSLDLAKAFESRKLDQLKQDAAEAQRRLQEQAATEKARLQQQLDAEKARLDAEKAKLDEEKARLQQQADAEKAKAEEQLRAKQAEEKAKAEEQLKQNLGDRVKKLF